MELTSQVLREVEFASERMPGRGYRMSEVDEFLEGAAIGVDMLREELAALRDRVDRAERVSADRTDADDEESIRRTLVLAQRTADLAIKEAQEEAAQHLDAARADAESIVSEARQNAERITTEGDKKLKDEVARLSVERDRLRGEIDVLVGLISAERERVTESLMTTLGYVEKNLSASPELAALASPIVTTPKATAPAAEATPAAPSSTAGAPASAPSASTASTIVEPDIDELEAAIAADAAAAAPSLPGKDSGWESEERLARPSLMALPSMDDLGDEAEPEADTTASWSYAEHANSPAS
jgi:DivIVA domain-containing protein